MQETVKMQSEDNFSGLKDSENKGRDVEVTVEIRKAKKEDHLLKRPNCVVDDDAGSPLQEQIQECMAADMTIEDIVKGKSFCAASW